MRLGRWLQLGWMGAVGCGTPTDGLQLGQEGEDPAMRDGLEQGDRGGGQGVFGRTEEDGSAGDRDTERARAAWDRARDASLVARVAGVEGHRDLWGVVRLREVGGQVHVQADVEGLPAGKHGFHVHQYGDCSAPEQESMGGHAQFEALGGGHGDHGGQTAPTGMRPGVVPGQQPYGAGAVDGVGSQGAGTAGGAGMARGTAGSQGGGGTQGAGTPVGGAEGMPPSQGEIAEETPSAAVHGNLGELEGGTQTASVTHLVPNLTVDDLPALVGLAVVIHENANDPSDPTGNAGAPIACGVLGVAQSAAPVVPANQAPQEGEPATPVPTTPPGGRPANEG